MQFLPGLLVLSLLASSSIAQAPSLSEALQNSGASNFASLIESDPTVSGIFQSSQIGTVYAPADGIPIPPSRLKMRRDLNTTAQQQLAIQAGQGVSNVSNLNDPPGVVQGTGDSNSNSGSGSVPVVSSPSPGLPTKRWVNTTSLATLFSGLGNNVSITKGNIPYSGGIIHITNGYFTLPESLSDTATANGHTTFVNLTNSNNLTESLNSITGITAFVPTNAAFASPNATKAYSSTSSLLSGHVIPNFSGYLPDLKDGATFKTQAGSTLTVSIKGGAVYINNAKIVGSNQILDNGVAHVIDQIITPVFPPVFQGTGSSLMRDATPFAVMSAGLAFILALVI